MQGDPFRLARKDVIMGIRIIGTGYYVPERVLTNSDLEKIVDTSDEWIQSRTGIRTRHIAEESTATSDLAMHAGQRAIENAGLTPADIDLVVVSTITPDSPTPSTATIVQRKLGIPPCMAFDIEAACTGLLYGLDIVHAMLAAKHRKTALLIGGDKLSGVTNWTDRSTCILFGDAASALVVQRTDEGDEDFYVASEVSANGYEAGFLQIPGFGSACPPSQEGIDAHAYTIQMNGPKTFQMAVISMSNACRNVMEKAHVTHDQISWAIAHQANDRIISAVADRVGISDRIYRNVARFGNTSSASIGICLDELNRSGQLKRGDLILTAAFGAGLTWAAELLRW